MIDRLHATWHDTHPYRCLTNLTNFWRPLAVPVISQLPIELLLPAAAAPRLHDHALAVAAAPLALLRVPWLSLPEPQIKHQIVTKTQETSCHASGAAQSP